MHAETEHVLREALALPETERAAVVESLLESLEPSDSPLDRLWAEEAEKRLLAFREGRMKAIPAHDVFAEFGRL